MNETTTSPEEKSIWGRINRLERRIEESATATFAPGLAENMYGTFDREDVTEEVFRTYSQLLLLSPDDENVAYRFAGALMRAKRFTEAKEMYSGIADRLTSSLLMLAMLELQIGNTREAEQKLREYNERSAIEGMLFMQRTLEQITLSKSR